MYLPASRSLPDRWWADGLRRIPGVRVRSSKGVLTLGALFHVLPWRWQIRLTPDGLDLVDGRRGHRMFRWDDDWELQYSAGRSNYSFRIVYLPESREREVLTLSGGTFSLTAGGLSREREVRALIDYLRENIDARAGLADPQRCRDLVSGLTTWVRHVHTSLTAPAVDDLISERIAGIALGRRLPPRRGQRRWTIDDADELVDDIMANMNVYDRHRVKRDWVDQRVRRILRQSPWPFEVLEPLRTPVE